MAEMSYHSNLQHMDMGAWACKSSEEPSHAVPDPIHTPYGLAAQ